MKRALPKRVTHRLEELVSQWGLAPPALPALESVLVSLADEHAPTAIGDPEAAVDAHVADSLVALSVPGLIEARSAADIGSGCGVPGLVLAAAIPKLRVQAVESISRKCAFIGAAAEDAGLGNVEVVNSRAEEWEDGIGICDFVTARALAPLPVLAEYAAPLLIEGGTLIAWKGDPTAAELESGAMAAAELGLEMDDPIPVEPWPSGGVRSLVTMRKIAATPERFPRRAGMAVKRPIA